MNKTGSSAKSGVGSGTSSDDSSLVGAERSATSTDNKARGASKEEDVKGSGVSTLNLVLGGFFGTLAFVVLGVLYVKRVRDHRRQRLAMGMGQGDDDDDDDDIENDLDKQFQNDFKRKFIPNLDPSDVSDPGWTDPELESDVESQQKEAVIVQANEIFDVLDEDGSGEITAQKFKFMLRKNEKLAKVFFRYSGYERPASGKWSDLAIGHGTKPIFTSLDTDNEHTSGLRRKRVLTVNEIIDWCYRTGASFDRHIKKYPYE